MNGRPFRVQDLPPTPIQQRKRPYLRQAPERAPLWRAVWREVLLPVLVAGVLMAGLVWLLCSTQGAA